MSQSLHSRAVHVIATDRFTLDGRKVGLLSTFFLGGSALAVLFWISRIDASALPWVFGFGLVGHLIAGFVERTTRSPYSLGFLTTTFYLAFGLISLFYATCYFNNYASYFGPWSDDTFYFENSLDFLDGNSDRFTLFEIVLGGLHRVIYSIGGTPSLMQLLPLNWMCGALIVSLSIQLSYDVTATKQNPVFLGLLLIGISIFTDSVVHLYRDAMLMVFVVGAMVCIARSRWGPALLVGSPVLFLRPFNFAILGVYLVLRFANVTRFERLANKMLFQLSVIAAIFVGTLVVDHVLKLGTYTRSLSDWTKGSRSLVEMIDSREAFWDSQTDANHKTAALWHSRWGRLVLPAVFLVSPCELSWEFTYAREYHQRFEKGVAHGLWPNPVLEAANVILLPIMLTLLALGLVRAWGTRASPELLFFVITLLLLSYISFQGRHRMALYVMYPVFWSWGMSEYRRRRRLGWAIAGAVVGVIVIRTAFI